MFTTIDTEIIRLNLHGLYVGMQFAMRVSQIFAHADKDCARHRAWLNV